MMVVSVDEARHIIHRGTLLCREGVFTRNINNVADSVLIECVRAPPHHVAHAYDFCWSPFTCSHTCVRHQDGYRSGEAYFIGEASFGPEASLVEMYEKEMQEILEGMNLVGDDDDDDYDENKYEI